MKCSVTLNYHLHGKKGEIKVNEKKGKMYRKEREKDERTYMQVDGERGENTGARGEKGEKLQKR